MATYIELQQQIQALQKKAESLKAQERQGVIDRMKEAIAVYDITADDLGLGRSRRSVTRAGRAEGTKPRKTSEKKSRIAAAYSDDKGNTWGGRGPRPKWLKDALAAGAKLEDFARGDADIAKRQA